MQRKNQQIWNWQKMGRNPDCTNSPVTPGSGYWILILGHCIRKASVGIAFKFHSPRRDVPPRSAAPSRGPADPAVVPPLQQMDIGQQGACPAKQSGPPSLSQNFHRSKPSVLLPPEILQNIKVSLPYFLVILHWDGLWPAGFYYEEFFFGPLLEKFVHSSNILAS